MHLYGRAADIDPMVDIAKRHNLVLIEDAAQAHGAKLGDRRVGSIGDAGCFSFYPGKNLGAMGEAGAVVTNDEKVAARIRQLRDHAQAGRHHHVEIGYNARMEGLQGAVLSVKLKHLDAWTASRRKHANHYHELLAGAKNLVLPQRPAQAESHVWHLFVVLVPGRGPRGHSKEVERARASARASTIPRPSRCSRPMPTWVTSRAISRWPRTSCGAASRCPCSPSSPTSNWNTRPRRCENACRPSTGRTAETIH